MNTTPESFAFQYNHEIICKLSKEFFFHLDEFDAFVAVMKLLAGAREKLILIPHNGGDSILLSKPEDQSAVDNTFYDLERKLFQAMSYGMERAKSRSSVPYSQQWMALREDIISKYANLPPGTSYDVKKALLSQFEQANTKIKEIMAL